MHRAGGIAAAICTGERHFRLSGFANAQSQLQQGSVMASRSAPASVRGIAAMATTAVRATVPRAASVSAAEVSPASVRRMHGKAWGGPGLRRSFHATRAAQQDSKMHMGVIVVPQQMAYVRPRTRFAALCARAVANAARQGESSELRARVSRPTCAQSGRRLTL